MNTHIIIGSIQIIGFAILAYAPFDRRRVRARWANFTFGICSVVGIVRGVADLARGFDWLALTSQASRRFDSYYDLAGGLLLGFLFSLFFSGQMSGKKQDMKHPPNTALEPTPTAP
jgi:hypothetical protein